MKKLILAFIVILLVGCNNNEFEADKEFKLVDDLSVNCKKLIELTYEKYQKDINLDISEAICVNNQTANLYEMAFKVNDELIYWYSYGNGINQAGNTENYEENKQKCTLETATDVEKMECSNQNLLIDNYKMYRNSIEGNSLAEYKVILVDISNLK